MVHEIVARDVEIAAVRAFLERAEAGLAALVLEGEAGIGKSTLWLSAVTQAQLPGSPCSPRGRRRPSAGSHTPG